MENMTNSEKLQVQSENQSLISNLSASIAVAIERVGSEPFNIENMVKDVVGEFPRMKEETLIKAIRNGALGKYGRTYKMTTQEVCIWIREYIKEETSKRLVL